LAARLGLAPSTVSGHLAKLSNAGLITVHQCGRQRLASLDRVDVAEAVESLTRLTTQEQQVSSLRAAKARTALREARSCYDHLAGRLGVAMADLFLARGWLVDRDGTWTIPHNGLQASAYGLGLAVTLPDRPGRVVRPCVDWTERRPHIAGRLGTALLSALLAAGWVGRRPHDRALTISHEGHQAFSRLAWSDARGAVQAGPIRSRTTTGISRDVRF
jgi:DNA-binding transcriptional ArsR family regulator